MKKIVITIILVTFFIMNILTIARATELPEGFYYQGEPTLDGIYHAMKANPTNWLNVSVGDKNIDNISANDEASNKDYYDDWKTEEGEDKTGDDKSLVTSRGGLCFGHSNERGDNHNISIREIDENSDEELQHLAWHIARSTLLGETGYSHGSENNSKGAIKNWLNRNNSKYQLDIKPQDIEQGSERDYKYYPDWGSYEVGGVTYPSLEEYINSISLGEDLKFEKFGSDNKPQVTTKTRTEDGKDVEYTYIGPYHLGLEKGELTQAIIKYKEETKKDDTTTLCSIDGENPIELKDIRTSYNGDFYIVKKGKLDEEIKEVTIKKKIQYIRARIVVAKPNGAGQNIAIFHGEWRETERERTVVGVDNTKFSIELKKIDKNSGDELKSTRFVLAKIGKDKEGQDVIESYIKRGNPAEYLDAIHEKNEGEALQKATLWKSGSHVNNLTEEGTYQFFEVQRENNKYEFCRKK